MDLSYLLYANRVQAAAAAGAIGLIAGIASCDATTNVIPTTRTVVARCPLKLSLGPP